MQQGRYNNYHGSKRQLVGQQPGLAPPAWKVNQQARKVAAAQAPPGSKILLSRLPTDVGEEEVEVRDFVDTARDSSDLTCRRVNRPYSRRP